MRDGDALKEDRIRENRGDLRNGRRYVHKTGDLNMKEVVSGKYSENGERRQRERGGGGGGGSEEARGRQKRGGGDSCAKTQKDCAHTKLITTA